MKIEVSRILVLTLIIGSAIVCTNKPDHKSLSESLTATSVSRTDAELFKLFDPFSLMEVRMFGELPNGVKTLANQNGMDEKGEGPAGRLREFMVGGASPTSALVTYEQFGFTPSYFAAAYVYSGGRWVAAHSWTIGKVTTLKEALSLIDISST